MRTKEAQTAAIAIVQRRRARSFSPWMLLTIICMIFAAVFVAWPILNVVLSSFTGTDPLAGWVEFVQNPKYLRSLGNTLLLSALVTLIATVIGVFLAYFNSRYGFWGKVVLSVLPITAILVPEVIVTQAWLMVFGNNGAVTRWLRESLEIALPSFYGWPGLLLVMPLTLYTYVYLGTLAALKGFDSQLEEAAMSLGSSPLLTRLKVTIPSILPAVASTSILVFTLTFGNFTTATILGGQLDLFSPLIYEAFLAETGGDPTMQSTLATVSIGMIAVVLLIQRILVDKRRYEMVQGRAWEPLKLRGVSGITLAIIAGLLSAATLLPLAMVTLLAFTKSNGPVLEWGKFTFENMNQVLLRDAQPILNTITYGLLACVISVMISIIIAVLVVKKRNLMTPILDYLVMLPLALSGTVLGLGLVMSFSSGALVLTNTAVIIVLVLVVRRLPHGIRNSSATLHSIPDSLEDASVSLGVPPFRSFIKVVLPLMVPGIAAAAVLTWTTIISELSASLVVYSAGKETIPIKVFQLMFTGLNGQAASYGLILLLLAIVPIVIVTRVFKIRLFN